MCGVLQAVKMMATVTKMQSVHSFPRTCSVHELEELEFSFYFLVLLLLVCLSFAGWECAFFFSLLSSTGARDAKNKTNKKKSLATFKTGSRNFKASLFFGWEAVAPTS